MAEPGQQRLHRSVENKQISGVCGGLAETYGWDAGLVRVLWAAVTLFTGVFPGLVLYVVMAAVLPVGE